MNRSQSTAVIVGVLSVSISAAVAQLTAPAGFDLSWNTVDCGGGTSTGGAFSITETIGQPDAGTCPPRKVYPKLRRISVYVGIEVSPVF
jgi:hypothetical protein